MISEDDDFESLEEVFDNLNGMEVSSANLENSDRSGGVESFEINLVGDGCWVELYMDKSGKIVFESYR